MQTDTTGVDFKHIPLKDIFISKTNPRKTIEDQAFQELVASIKVDKVQTPIRVRPVPGGKYEIVYGERRFRASLQAGHDDIPCTVVEMTDDEAEKQQFIENMVRADVHPMDEAVKFAEMMSSKREHQYTPEDIAALINRSPTYVLQRLELNNMIDILKKDFWAGKFNTAMALTFATIHPSDQAEARKDMLEWNTKDQYKSHKNLHEYINRHIRKDLAKAPFDKEDPELNPEMGKCSTCPHRSGANLLFGDLKEKNICFRQECFDVKIVNHTIGQIENVLNHHPEIKFMGDSNHMDPIIKKYLSDNKAEVLGTYSNGLSNYKDKGAIGVKILSVSGSSMGTITTMYRSGTNNNGTKRKQDIKELQKAGAKQEDLLAAIETNIAGIEERQRRSLELDAEKVWSRIHEELVPGELMHGGKELTRIETAALIIAMDNKMGYQSDNKIEKLLGYKYGSKKTKYQLALEASSDVYNACVRYFIINVLDSAQGEWNKERIKPLYDMTAQYYPAEIDKIKADQAEVAKKRIERSNERLATLKKEKAALSPKKATPDKKQK